MKILMAFVNFHKHKIQNCFREIKNMKDKIFSFQLKKNTSAKRLQMMLDLKMCPSPLFD